jgi:hypothetical protein
MSSQAVTFAGASFAAAFSAVPALAAFASGYFSFGAFTTSYWRWRWMAAEARCS